MLQLISVLLALGVALPMQPSNVAPAGTLRAAFIADNPVQGRVDPQTGAVVGLAADLTRELARRLGVPYTIVPLPGPGLVLDSVREGKSDIGFLAYEADRARLVDFSSPYVLATSAYLVRVDSPFRSSADVDRAGVNIGAVTGQSQQIYVSAQIKNARVVVLPTAPPADVVATMIVKGELDVFAANRQRMEDAARTSPQVRVLADSFLDIAQSIVVEKGQAARLTEINRFLADVRASGFVKASVDRAKLGGVEVAR